MGAPTPLYFFSSVTRQVSDVRVTFERGAVESISIADVMYTGQLAGIISTCLSSLTATCKYPP